MFLVGSCGVLNIMVNGIKPLLVSCSSLMLSRRDLFEHASLAAINEPT